MNIKHIFKAIIFSIFLAGFYMARANSECPRKEFEQFSKLVGTWKVEWKYRVAPPDKYETSAANSIIEKNAVGCVLTENLFGSLSGKPFNVLVLYNFANAETLERIWLDSGHGRFLQFKGTADKEIVRFEWERDMDDGRKMLLKNEYRDIKKDSFVSETFLSTDNGKTWGLVQQAKYSRQSDKKNPAANTQN